MAQAEDAHKSAEASASDRLAAQDKHAADVKDLSAKLAAAAAEKLALQRGFEVHNPFSAKLHAECILVLLYGQLLLCRCMLSGAAVAEKFH